MELTKKLDFYSKLFIFYGLTNFEIESCISLTAPFFREFSRGEIIYSKESDEKMIGFVFSGKCEVYRGTEGKVVSLNILDSGCSFGIASLFSEDNSFPTRVRAISKCSVMFMTRGDIFKLIEYNYKISFNIMRFLTDRICFLNNKIATFSSQNVEKKLANYILSEYCRQKKTEIPFNCKKSAEAISAGRASLYRAIDCLVREGVIAFESKRINIIDLEGLERITK